MMTIDEVKDGPSYTPSCLWRRAEKIKFPFSPRGLYSEIRTTILEIM